MTHVYIKSRNVFRQTDKAAIDIHERLPIGSYVLQVDDGGFFFQPIDAFTLPKRIYGETGDHSTRILTTFEDRPGVTGVLLHGDKGSGKTLLAKKLCLDAAKIGMVTIVINQPIAGDALNFLVANMKQPAIFLIDEFEKVYSESSSQTALLTLLDGVVTTKKLFVFTCNEKYKVNEYMLNRPGRIFYKIGYGSISSRFIREYCQDNLDNKDEIEQVVRVREAFYDFNFDMLKALVEEMNRFKENPRDALRYLNIEQNYGGRRTYRAALEATVDGNKVSVFSPTANVSAAPFTEQVSLFYYICKDEMLALTGDYHESADHDEDVSKLVQSTIKRLHAEEAVRHTIIFDPSHIIDVRDESRVIHFKKDKYELTLTKEIEPVYSYIKRSTEF